MEILSQGTGAPFWELLDKMFDMLVRLDGEANLGVGFDNCVGNLSGLGIDRKVERPILGLSVAPSESEILWKEFLESLIVRGLCGVNQIVSDDHSGLNAARKAVFTNTKW